MPTPKPGAPIQSPCALAGITAAHVRQAAATPVASFLILISGVIDLFGERWPARSVPLIPFGTRPTELTVKFNPKTPELSSRRPIPRNRIVDRVGLVDLLRLNCEFHTIERRCGKLCSA